MPGIFLSCVSSEFHGPTGYGTIPWPGSYRTQLASFLGRCGQKVVFQEEFAQGGGDLLAKMDAYISKECKAVVHLIGHARGWCLEDDLPTRMATSDAVHNLLTKYGDTFLANRPDLRSKLLARNFHGLSVTQWEAYLAIHHNKPLLVFTFADTAERHPGLQVETAPPSDRVSQAQHLAWLRQTGFDRDEQIQNQSHFKERVIEALVWEKVLTQEQSQPQPRTTDFTSIGSLFMGRAEDMEKLRASLRKEHARATAIVASQVIHGQGGIGKTRLAVEFGLAHAEEYTALLFIEADTPARFEANLAKLAGPLVLNLLPEDAKDDVKLPAVLQWLRSHPGYFLILDNVDSEAAAQAVEEKLALLSTGHVVITSRITQWSESVEPLQLDVLSEDAATAFLLKATERKAGSGRIVTPTDEAEARLLAKDVDGLALALEQSAAFIRTKQITIAKYRQRWKEFDTKVRDFRVGRLMKYERSVLTTWQTTFDQLLASSVSLLRACSVLAPAPIPLHLLESINTNCEDDLAELVKFSLASRSDDGEMVRVHKVVQEIVVFRMEESDQQRIIQQVQDALRSLFSDTVDHTLMPRRSSVLAHVDAVVAHAGRFTPFARRCALLRADVAFHQWLIGQLPAALANINASIEWGLKQSPVEERGVAILRATRASIRRDQGDLPGALADISDSIEWGLKQSPVDERSVAIRRATRASIRRDQGDLPGALADISDSIEWGLKQSPVDERGVAIDRATRASIRQAQGDLPGALADISDSIEWGLKQSPVDERGVAILRATRASIRRDQGDLPGALADISDSIEWGLKQSPVDERSVAIDRVTLARVLREQRSLSEALDAINQSLDWFLAEQPQNQRWIAKARAARAEIRRDSGKPSEARSDITLALAWYESNLPGDTRTIGEMNAIRESISAT